MLACNAEENHTVLRGGVRFCGLDSKQVSPECKSRVVMNSAGLLIIIIYFIVIQT